MLAALVLIFAIVGIASHFHRKNSVTLEEYARNHSQQAKQDEQSADVSDNTVSENAAKKDDSAEISQIGEAEEQTISPERVTYPASAGTETECFYYEPLSEDLKQYITGISYPEGNQSGQDASDIAIDYSDLRYVHVLHYDFDGNSTEGELICNAAIAGDLLDIFYELYRNEYRIEKIRLIDEYDGDDTASMEDNNTSCFNYRTVEGSNSLSKHALGLAIDINPLYNPYVTYDKDELRISPKGSEAYADRSVDFPYKIDENDFCYKLFTEHGFTWGGNWNSCKDYQHFQKTP